MKINYIVLIAIILVSCVSNKEINTLSAPSTTVEEEKVSLSQTLSITAINLSEDMSRLSTKNDEIFVFIYDYSDTNKLNAPLVSTKLIFDAENSIHTISVPNLSNCILFFIEEDSFRTAIQLEPVVRVYFKEIMKADDYNKIQKYLSEDDLLGFKILDSRTSTFSFSGMSSLDKFEYLLELN